MMKKTGFWRIRILIIIVILGSIAGGIYWVNRSPSLEDQVREDMMRRMREQGGDFGGLAEAMLGLMGGPDAAIAVMRNNGTTPLHYAASVGNREIMRNALAEGIDVNATDGTGMTPMHYAAGCNDGVGVIELLVEAGGDINARGTDNGWTPLMTAIDKECSRPAGELIAAGADLNLVGMMGRSALLLATQNDDDLVMLLLKAGADVKIGRSFGADVMVWSSMKRSKEVSLAILAAGAKPDGKTDDGYLAIHFAAGKGHTELIRALIKAGTDVDAPGEDKKTALQIAVENDLEKTVKLLLDSGASVNARDADGWTAMHYAADSNEILKRLIAAGAEVNVYSNDGRSPLHNAVNGGSIEAVKLLLAHKADVNVRTKKGWSPITLSVGWDAELRKVLAAAGAREESWTPLHTAALDGAPTVLVKALNDGADVNLPDRVRRTALLLACLRQMSPEAVGCIAALLEAKADTNIQDIDGIAPIHIACYRQNAELLEQLLAAGAKASLAEADGTTPLHIACLKGKLPMIKRLIAVGADLNARTEDGDSPLHLLYDPDGSASFSDKDDIAAYVVSKGGDLRAKNKAGQFVFDLVGYVSDDLFDGLVKKARYLENESQFDALLTSVGKAPLPDAKTPQDAIRRAGMLAAGPDKKAFVACFNGSDDQISIIEEIYATGKNTISLRKAMIDAYGLDGWYVFNDGNGISFLWIWTKLAQLSEDEFNINGPVAYCNSEMGSIMLRRDKIGQWHIESGSLVRGATDVGAVLEIQRKITKLLKELTRMAGKDGVTPDQLEKKAMDIFSQS